MILDNRQLENYWQIFGAEKILFLWQEYLSQAKSIWQKLDSQEPIAGQQDFHNWRSSSLVFGMQDFAAHCTRIEENILQKRTANLQEQIKECKDCFEQSIYAVNKTISNMEKNNDR